MEMQQAVSLRWRQAVETGDIGLWDLRPRLDTVHHSPSWKQRLGFPEPNAADGTHFWRCRVHPDDLDAMLAAMRAHVHGGLPTYQASFRLRSNGSGYLTVHSRGRVVERDAQGRAVRMVGTMIDLTGRPATPRPGLPGRPLHTIAGPAIALPFHHLLSVERPFPAVAEARDRLLAQVEDLLHAALAQLEAQQAGSPAGSSAAP